MTEVTSLKLTVFIFYLTLLVDEDQEVTIKPIPAMMMVDDNDNQRMKEMNAILEDRVNCE